MQLIKEKQVSPIESEVLARISIIRPILTSLLIGIKQDILDELGGLDKVKLKMLPRAYRPGAGDINRTISRQPFAGITISKNFDNQSLIF